MALNEQMEMFEDGGLMDEGGTVDPVSGNDVPPGSTQEEVRDDICCLSLLFRLSQSPTG